MNAELAAARQTIIDLGERAKCSIPYCNERRKAKGTGCRQGTCELHCDLFKAVYRRCLMPVDAIWKHVAANRIDVDVLRDFATNDVHAGARRDYLDAMSSDAQGCAGRALSPRKCTSSVSNSEGITVEHLEHLLMFGQNAV